MKITRIDLFNNADRFFDAMIEIELEGEFNEDELLILDLIDDIEDAEDGEDEFKEDESYGDGDDTWKEMSYRNYTQCSLDCTENFRAKKNIPLHFAHNWRWALKTDEDVAELEELIAEHDEDTV